MKKLKFFASLSMVFFSLSSFGAQSGDVSYDAIYQHLLQQYYTQLATKDAREVLGKSPFLINSEITLSATDVKKDKEETAPLRLPLTRLSLDESEFQRLSADSFGPETLNELLEMVSEIKLSITVSPEMSEEVKAVLKKQILNDLGSELLEEDDIEFVTANPEWIRFRLAQEISNPPTIAGAATEENQKNKIFRIAEVAGLGLIALLIFFVAMMMKKLTSEVGQRVDHLVNAVKERSDSPENMSMPNLGSAPGTVKSEEREVSFEGGGSTFLSKMEPNILVAFAKDVSEDSHWMGATRVLLDDLLGTELSNQLETKFEAANIEVESHVDPEMKRALEKEITFHLYQNASEYRRILRSPIGSIASKLKIQDLLSIAEMVSPTEIIVLVNSLSPVRKKQFIQSLGIEKRMMIADFSNLEMSVSEMKVKELNLAEKIEQVALTQNGVETTPKKVNLSYLSDSILKASGFEEDEAFDLKAKEIGQMYPGFLKTIHEADEAFWSQVNLLDLALASFGYSESILDEMKQKLNEKRSKWFTNFLAKVRSVPIQYSSPESSGARTKLMQQMKRQEKPDADEVASEKDRKTDVA